MRNAYAPYSEFKVGAAVRAPSGAIYAGANVENVAYPQGACAEASALGALVTAGEIERSPRSPWWPRRSSAARRAEAAASAWRSSATRTRPSISAAPAPSRSQTTLAELLPRGVRTRGAGPVNDAAAVLAERAPAPPRVGVVLGSGLGAVADAVEDAVVVGYEELPGFPQPTVAGHAGQAVLGRIARRRASRCSRGERTSTRAAILRRCGFRSGL